MKSQICITKDEYERLKEDSKIVEAISKLDSDVVKSITTSLKQAHEGKLRRVF